MFGKRSDPKISVLPTCFAAYRSGNIAAERDCALCVFLESCTERSAKYAAATRQERDPNGLEVAAPGAKLDAGKPELALLQDFAGALREVGKVATFGARKYSRGGWRHVDDGIHRYTSAMWRHWLDEADSPIDADSQCYHAAQVAWNALARLQLMLQNVSSSHARPESQPGSPDAAPEPAAGGSSAAGKPGVPPLPILGDMP